MSVDTGIPADRRVAAELRAEIERLVQIAARKPGLALREGRPGCAWSFNWDQDVVTVNPVDLRTLAPDLCRGVALHEASHAAITVLHRFIPEGLIRALMPLLNAVEDLRIDVWQRRRFPGSAPWLDAHNAAIRATARERELPRSRQVQFLLGMLERGYFGETAPGTLPEVLSALDACRAPIARAVACQPPPGDDPAGVLASQRGMWQMVRERILPVWRSLVELDRREGIGDLARQELESFLEEHGGNSIAGGGRRAGRGGRIVRRPPTASGNAARWEGRGPRAGHAAAQEDDPHAVARLTGRYEAAWKRVAPVADRLGDELLRILVPRRRMRWSGGHASGPRLEIRRAMQCEADPRQAQTLWSRPLLPHRCDPAVTLLVDRSSSMREGSLIDRALEGTVLLVEVCRRIGVASSVWSFARETSRDVGWDDPLDMAARSRIGSLPALCGGSTGMAAALAIVGREFAMRSGDPKLLFVIGDGEPDDQAATLAAAGRLATEGVITIGLGLGDGTAGLGRYFERSVVGIAPEALVDHLAGLLAESLLEGA